MNTKKIVFGESWSRLITGYLVYIPLIYVLSSLFAGGAYAELMASIGCLVTPWVATPKKGLAPIIFMAFLISIGSADQVYEMLLPFVGTLILALLARKLLPGQWLRETEYWNSVNPLKWRS